MLPDAHGDMKIYTLDLMDHNSTTPTEHSATINSLGVKNRKFTTSGHAVCGERIEGGASVKDVHFSTQTCVYSWSVMAIWRPRSDGRDIGGVARAEGGDVVACVYTPSKISIGKVRVLVRRACVCFRACDRAGILFTSINRIL